MLPVGAAGRIDFEAAETGVARDGVKFCFAWSMDSLINLCIPDSIIGVIVSFVFPSRVEAASVKSRGRSNGGARGLVFSVVSSLVTSSITGFNSEIGNRILGFAKTTLSDMSLSLSPLNAISVAQGERLSQIGHADTTIPVIPSDVPVGQL